MPERKPAAQFPFERSFAFIVGINDYDRQGDAPPLQTAVSDARALARVLKQQPHNFAVTLLENADGAQLRELLEKTIPDLNIGASDRVLFYFAGHGIADDAEGRPEGYLLPADARLDAVDSFLPMKSLYEALRPLACPHLLLVLDCCFAGAFRWASKERAARPRVPQRITEYRLRRFCEDHAWQVITSTSYYQKAQDVSSLKTRALGKREQLLQARTDSAAEHSPFAKALLEGLAGLADSRVGERGDGVITGSELYSFIRDRIVEDAAPGSGGEAQKPNHIFLEKDKGGEFIFLHPKHPLNPLPDVERNPYKGLASYDESDQELFFGRSGVIKKLQQLAAQRQLLVISGISGSGKSSLVKAGLLPELREAGWRILPVLRPGANPLRSLEKRFREWQVFSLSEASLAALGREELPEEALENLRAIVGQEAVGERAFALLLKQALADVRGLPLCLSAAAHRALQGAGIPQNVHEKLTGLIDRRFAREADFWSAVREAAGKPPEREDQMAILAHASAGLVWQHAAAAPLFPAMPALDPQDPAPLLQVLKQQQTVLLIDQYEELITRCQDKQERQQYEALLKALLDGTASDEFKLILTVRADFEPLLDKGPLQDDWEAGRFLVTALSPEELKEVIEMPAYQEVLDFEPGLVEEIVNEVSQSPGALPLLSYTLSALYEAFRTRPAKGQQRTLSRADYEALGKVRGALSSGADRLYRRLDAPHQATLKKIMLRLVSLEGGEPASRRALLEELEYPDEAENLRVGHILEQFLEARLLVRGRDSSGAVYVEPAHDALVKAWQTLSDWIEADGRDTILLQRRLSRAVREYQHPTLPAEAQDDEKQLRDYRKRSLWNDNPRLAQLVEIQRSKDPTDNWLNRQELDFVTESDHRKKFRSRVLRATVTAVLAVLASLTVWALLQSAEARRQAREANIQLAQNYWENARSARDAGRMLNARHLAVTAASISPEAALTGNIALDLIQPGVIYPLREVYQRQRAKDPGGRAVWDTPLSGDHTALLAWDSSAVTVWNTASWEPLGRPQPDSAVINAHFLANGRMAVSWNARQLRLWDTVSGALPGPALPHAGQVREVLLNAGATRLLVREPQAVSLWEVPSGQLLRRWAFAEDLHGAAFEPDDSAVLVRVGRTVYRCDLASGEQVPLLKHVNQVSQVLTKSDGSGWITFSANNFPREVTFQVWNRLADAPLAEVNLGYRVESAFLRDESRFLTWGGEFIGRSGGARLWDAANGQLMMALPHEGVVEGVQFSRDERRLLTWSWDNKVRIWDLDSGEIPVAIDHPGTPFEAVWLRDETRLLTRGWRSVRLWDAEYGEAAGDSIGHGTHLDGMCLNRDETLLLTWGFDDDVPGYARLSHLATGRWITDLPHDSIEGAAFNADETAILTWNATSTRVWEMARGDTMRQMFHGDAVAGMCFSPDEQQFLSWGSKSARLWNLSTGQPLGEPLAHGSGLRGAAFSEDGTRIFTWGGRRICAWEPTSGTQQAGVEQDIYISGARLLPGDRQILIWGGSGARVWDLTTKQPAGEMITHEDGYLSGAETSSDGRRILSWSRDSTARVWEVSEGREVARFRHDGYAEGGIFSDGGTRALTWSGGQIRCWRVEDGTQIGRGIDQNGRIGGVTYNHDQTLLLTWGLEYEGSTLGAWIWNAGTGQLVKRFEPGYIVKGAMFNRDETLLLTWSTNGVRLWDVQSGRQVGESMGQGNANRAYFVSAGERVMTEGENGVQLWETHSGRLLGQSTGQRSLLNAAEILLFTWDWNNPDGSINFWDIGLDHDFPSDKWILESEALSGTRFNPQAKKIESLSADAWRQLRAEYLDFARGHYRQCRYPRANRFRKAFPQEAEKIRPGE